MNNIITIPEIRGNALNIYQDVYHRCHQQVANGGNAIVDCTNMHSINNECAAILFGKLLIDDKCGSISCKNLNSRLFVTICNGINKRFQEKFPMGIQAWGTGRITIPQIELMDGNVWSTIQLGNEISHLLHRV